MSGTESFSQRLKSKLFLKTTNRKSENLELILVSQIPKFLRCSSRQPANNQIFFMNNLQITKNPQITNPHYTVCYICKENKYSQTFGNFKSAKKLGFANHKYTNYKSKNNKKCWVRKSQICKCHISRMSGKYFKLVSGQIRSS
jgi:hypothetical protein